MASRRKTSRSKEVRKRSRRSPDVSDALSISIRDRIDRGIRGRPNDPRGADSAVQSARRRVCRSPGDVREAESGGLAAEDGVRLESDIVREQIRFDGLAQLAMNLISALDKYRLLLLQDRK